MIIALIYLTYLIMRVAVNSDRLYESAICIGIAIHLGFQSIINIAVALNVFPNTGVSGNLYVSGTNRWRDRILRSIHFLEHQREAISEYGELNS